MDYARLEKDILQKLGEELSCDLFYHRKEHTVQVVESAEIIGVEEGVAGDDMVLLKTAALLHDAGFLECPSSNEPLACDIAEKILPNYGYLPEQIKTINGMIMATAIPQTPNNLLQNIICDADLSYLGDDDATCLASNLRNEMKLVLDREFTDIEWIDFQLGFLNVHHFFTPYAKDKLNSGKARYIKSLQAAKKAVEEKEGK